MSEIKAEQGDTIVINTVVPIFLMVRKDKIMMEPMYARYMDRDIYLEAKEILGTIIVYPIVKEAQ